jgi:Flp pilus assembly CpaE family ATPase
MSVYRDMLKQVNASGESQKQSPSALIELPHFGPLRRDLEMLCASLQDSEHQNGCINFLGLESRSGVSSIALTTAQIMAELHPSDVLFVEINAHSDHESYLPSDVDPNSFYKFLNDTSVPITTSGPLHLLSARGRSIPLTRIPQDTLVNIINTLKTKFKWIIFDSPPARFPESILCSQLTDSTLVVLESNRSRKHAAKALCAQLQERNVKILGTVLNKRRMVIPEWVYQLLFK